MIGCKGILNINVLEKDINKYFIHRINEIFNEKLNEFKEKGIINFEEINAHYIPAHCYGPLATQNTLFLSFIYHDKKTLLKTTEVFPIYSLEYLLKKREKKCQSN